MEKSRRAAMEKQFVQAIFCAPTGDYKDKPYPSRLTDEVFLALAEAGINRIFGFGYDSRKETVEKTFELCEKYGIGYCPTPVIQGVYTRVVPGEDGRKPFYEMTEQEIAELDKQFLAEIEPWAEHKAFAGIFFSDEAGYLAAEGIAHAKKVFDEHYGEYEFHTNFYSYSINEAIFWGGMSGDIPHKLPFELTGDMAITFQNRFHFYDRLVDNLYSRENFTFMSQDKYPYELFWPTVPTSVHVALFELNAYFNEKKKEYGCRFYNYMQVGQWFTDKRPMTFAETALQMHVTAAYGSDGFAYFPGCFPLDYAGSDNPGFQYAEQGGSSLIDIEGHPTIMCGWIAKLNQYFARIEQDILSSELIGVDSFGTYQNGFTEEEIEDLPDNECIFRGDLPDMLRHKGNLQIESDNEVMASVFEQSGKKRYYLVNLSTIHDSQVTISLPPGAYKMYTLEDEKHIMARNVLKIEAGCGVYIVEL